MAELKRIDVGFQGGQVLSIRVAQDGFDGLRRALVEEGSDRWHELETQDSRVALDLAQVVYVQLDTEDSRVGF